METTFDQLDDYPLSYRKKTTKAFDLSGSLFGGPPESRTARLTSTKEAACTRPTANSGQVTGR